jgi:hypothetical protein
MKSVLTQRTQSSDTESTERKELFRLGLRGFCGSRSVFSVIKTDHLQLFFLIDALRVLYKTNRMGKIKSS